MTPSPIDYGLIRTAFARAIQSALGLSSNQVVQLQWNEPVAKRPDLPFAAFMLTGLGQHFGRDSSFISDEDAGILTYHGPRMLTAMFQFFGESSEQAFGMACAWHAALDQEPTQDILLDVGKIAVWNRQPPTNTTDLVFTGYEGRATLNAMFGIEAVSNATVGIIEHVPVDGMVSDGLGEIDVSFTANEEF